MAHPIRVGETIKLRFAFEGKEDASGVVVKAILRNGADTQIGSTLTLTHTGEGVFKNDSVAMPDTPIVTARYIVYQVDGITVHTSWPSTMDEFRKDLLSEAIISAELLASASSTTTNVRTNAAQANGFYDETVLIVINSAGIGVRRVTGYLNSNGAFTVTPALPFTPATGDRVVVLGQNANLSAVTLATATSSIATNLDTTISSRAQQASNSEKIVAVIDENGAVIANLSVVTDEKLVTIIED